ncbi:hypothetical protein SCMU_27760 [Sinomonas cyclohexanicum]|uniref:Uncharacterized protein n=1 Tax=Sinomonas cyclohexanicum TaxID=322009 RepID=A0ABN6FJF8_SINCY|nr:hypothetical protein [Corynebacterium cyclohexanicum]BCT76934.1 hypothetical protein SCMU_27760 [Corynebacterium cyclohexanicum]
MSIRRTARTAKATPVVPESVADGCAAVVCPICGDLHHYGAAQLQPVPIRPGQTRTVTCVRARTLAAQRRSLDAMRELVWSGYGSGRFAIKFTHQPKEKA